jgi:PilZ domain-containing protein
VEGRIEIQNILVAGWAAMNEISSQHLLAVVLLCTLHLAAGFAVGLFSADGYRRKEPTRGRSKLKKSLRLYREGFDRVSQQANKLSSMTTGRGQQLPEAFVSAVRELTQTTREIKQDIHRAGPRPKTSADDPSLPMSAGELRNLVRFSEPTEPATDQVEGQRYAYNVPQWMGRCVGSRMPAPDDFDRVMCCDISLEGMSFYADDVQIGQSVVIAIGSDEASAFVVAEIRHRRVISFNDKLTYRVGCRFVKRLSDSEDGELIDGYRKTLFVNQPVAAI